MKKFLISSAFAATFALLAACGGDSSSGSDESQTSTGEDAIVETVNDLLNCTEMREGATAYVKSEKMAYVCKDGDWMPDTAEETSDSDEDVSSSSQVGDVDSESSEVFAGSSSNVASSSSSNVMASSSSVKQSSSSEAEVVVMPSNTYDCKVYNCVSTDDLKSGITYGEILDSRDNQVYKTLTIGEEENTQTWMAQNLNYALDEKYVATMGEYAWSGCFHNDTTYCSKYGRLYTWEVAMDNANCAQGKICSPNGIVRGVCPSGWHLPSTSEWRTLFENVGGLNAAGTALKTATGWNSQTGDDADRDAYGFAVLPAGGRYDSHYFYHDGEFAVFWSSTETNGDFADNENFIHYNYDVVQGNDRKFNAFSVRCLRN